MRLSGLGAVLTGSLVAVTGIARGQDDCSSPAHGIRSRALYPPDGSVGVPLNAMVTVRYLRSSSYPPDDELRANLVLQPKNGQPVELVRDVFPAGGSAYTETAVRLKPVQPLLPGTSYEVLDRYTIPCGPVDPCQLGAHAVFASFTTGTASDVSAPQFAGAVSLAVRPFFQCPGYSNRPFALGWDKATDDLAGQVLAYNIYRDGETLPLASYLTATSATLAVSCDVVSGQVFPNFIRATFSRNYTGRNESGSYYVRAVDWAGNQDTNQATLRIVDPCLAAPWADGGANQPSLDAGATADGPVDVADGPSPVVDAPTPIVDSPAVVDGPAPVADATSVVHAGADGPAKRSSGGGCTVNPSAGGGTALVPLVLSLLLLGRRRR